MKPDNPKLKLGLMANRVQFTILVIVNAFVGAMVGMERSIFPEFALSTFGIKENTAVLSFIIAFGISKAFANFFTGKLIQVFGRKPILVFGWIMALPVPFLLLLADKWSWIIIANILLGISQGLTWSCTVIMKIDLVGSKDRGLAMGINEFAGYLSIGIMALFSGWLVDYYDSVQPVFYFGIGVAVLGLFLSIIWVRDTSLFVEHEVISSQNQVINLNGTFWDTTFRHKALSSITQAGMINNFNDGMLWGMLPVILMSLFFDATDIGQLVAVYPIIWGVGQLFTGKLGDIYSKKTILIIGMLLQGIAIMILPKGNFYWHFFLIAFFIGLGTALVYPNFLAAAAEHASIRQRAEIIGFFRFWRDMGYAIGALFSGIIADSLGVNYAFYFVGILTVVSGFIILFRMPEKAS